MTSSSSWSSDREESGSDVGMGGSGRYGAWGRGKKYEATPFKKLIIGVVS